MAGTEHLVGGLRAGIATGGLFSWIDDVASGTATAAAGASKVIGSVFGAVGAVFAVIDMGFAIKEVLQKDPTLEELQRAMAITKKQVDLCQETSKKIKELHWQIVNDEGLSSE